MRSVLAGTLMLAIGLLVIFVLVPVGVVEPRTVKFAALSPSFYPRIVAICLCVLGGAVLVNALIKRPVDDTAEPVAHPNGIVRTLAFFAILIFLALTVEKLGFVLAGAIAILTSMTLAGERRWWLVLVVAIVLPLLLHFFFLKVASVPIPAGVLAPYLQGL
jgi:hypothetical protein